MKTIKRILSQYADSYKSLFRYNHIQNQLSDYIEDNINEDNSILSALTYRFNVLSYIALSLTTDNKNLIQLEVKNTNAIAPREPRLSFKKDDSYRTLSYKISRNFFKKLSYIDYGKT